MHTITVANTKGGVGKSTTVRNLATALHDLGNKVLIIDSDPQGSITSSFGIDKKELKDTIFTMMNQVIDDDPVKDATIKLENGISLLPTNLNLAAMDAKLVMVNFGREMVLADALEQISMDYDYCIVDTYGSLGMLMTNALMISDEVIIPVTPDRDCQDGLDQFIGFLESSFARMRKGGKNVEIGGLLFTNVEQRTRIAKDYKDIIRREYGGKYNIYETELSHSQVVKKASDKYQAVSEFVKNAAEDKTAQEFKSLAEEITVGCSRSRVR